MIAFVVFLILGVLAACLCPLVINRISQENTQYKDFVSAHSMAVRHLRQINARHHFQHVTGICLQGCYDNENMYDDISPYDYLVYQLIFRRSEVQEGLNACAQNRQIYAVYRKAIQDACFYGRYDEEVTLRDTERLRVEEEKLFSKTLQHPTLQFFATVELQLTYINGRRRSRKFARFSEEQVIEILKRMSEKRGDFYLDEGVWQSICRVERGKVTNKMRFAVYSRDGYRCRKCGRHTEDLEVDHIFPISKGGKSVFENLQTLCHQCNSQKSNTVEAGATAPRRMNTGEGRVCALCAAPLRLRRGKYGNFYGCTNYPNCRYTERE